ncbi:hypothetical protein H0H92_000082 [Tricholoma furcatifolium]|nr:hypothetical protein H0H92_000082 [Tricholoma furcatifolium]
MVRVSSRRHKERTRPNLSPPKLGVTHFAYLSGLKTSKALGLHKKYTPRYPQLNLRPSTPPEVLQPVVPHPHTLKLSDLECSRVLGEGATGQVLLVRSVCERHRLDRSGSFYALKAYPKRYARLTDNLYPSDKDKERSILMSLPWNPFIAGIVDVFSDEKNLYTMLEFLPCGSFRGLLQSRGPFDATTAAFYFCNIVAGIDFLEKHNIYHRDLKPENILVGADGYLVLTDFGEGVHQHDYENNHWIQVGSPVYSAPELMSSNLNGASTFAAIDWWSAGVILYEMTYKKLPWWGRSEFDIHSKTTLGIIHWRPGIRPSKVLKSLITGLLTVDSAKRLGVNGAQEVMTHEWLKTVKWSKIKGRTYLAPYVPHKPHDLGERWHKLPLPSPRKIPGVGKVINPPSHLVYNDCFPKVNVEPEDNYAVSNAAEGQPQQDLQDYNCPFASKQ